MLRLNPNNLPSHLKEQIERKLKQNNGENVESKLPKHIDIALSESIQNSCKSRALTERVKSPIHQKLWDAIKDLEGAELEFKGAVPKRRFSLDIAFPALKIAVEVDGWEHHGKHKVAHTKDRERQNLLTLNGWCILRYTAKQIFGDVWQCRKEILSLIELVQRENDRLFENLP